MRLVNTITFFRIVSFPVLVFLLFTRNLEVFKWLIVAGFLTDALDGFLARKLKAQSILGARFDSIGDDLTVLAAILGLFVFQPEFLRKEWLIITILLILFFIQTGYAFLKYQKMTSFHTYGAKLAAVFQGFFLCSMFFFKEPAYWLFYSTVILTGLELIEEISMVYVLQNWKSDVRGLYWAIQIKKERDVKPHPQD
ncbi:MAG: CDP-alcohol phosphatidyltransferase family protein [Cyclobacteriaceae bacterium]|jgi:CDP-diacylglycerol--glycerol-3-phosphate 3-phosphatidyltransferase|nr:CDP-alcohol phosphatidyltransferase family protein [Cyclobacteriaceae bacterium]